MGDLEPRTVVVVAAPPLPSFAMRRTVPLLTILLAMALVAAACGDDDSSATTGGDEPGPATTVVSPTTAPQEGTITTPEYLAFRSQPAACDAQAPAPARELRFDRPDDLGLSGTVTATIQTSCGPIEIELDADRAPVTVNSFVFLAQSGYFDGTAVHRAYEGFMVQMGDPTASGSGNPGYLLVDELPAADFSYTRGVVAMANAGPNSAGSQFFIMLDDYPLPPDYSVFGEVVSGMENLDAMVAVPMGPNPGDAVPSRPLETIYIERVDVSG